MKEENPSQDSTERYLDHLRNLLRRFYGVAKNYGLIARERQTFIQGYMTAGLVQAIVTRDQLREVMEEENFEVFEMNVAERRRKHKVDMVSVQDEQYLDIPTFVRGALKIL
jgi:hypothetical protein